MNQIQEASREIQETVIALTLARTAAQEAWMLARLERLAIKLSDATIAEMRSPSRFDR